MYSIKYFFQIIYLYKNAVFPMNSDCIFTPLQLILLKALP